MYLTSLISSQITSLMNYKSEQQLKETKGNSVLLADNCPENGTGTKEQVRWKESDPLH